MHANLLIGNDIEKIDMEIDKIAKELNSNIIEFPINSITEIRELERFTSRSREKILLVIRDIQNAGTESLNAFLKTLEEPGENYSFALTANALSGILPTIISRCKLIYCAKQAKGEENLDSELFVRGKLSDRIKIADKYKKRGEAIKFVTDTINLLHIFLMQSDDKNKFLRPLKFMSKCYENLNINANVNLQFSNLIVKLENAKDP